MSNQPYPADSSHYLSSYPPSHSHEDEFKASYDDLIDHYAAPYAQTAQHRTYAVESAPAMNSSQHRRGPSYPLSHNMSKQSQSTEFSQKPYEFSVKGEGSVVQGYPPPGAVIDKDAPGFWARVLPESLACRLYVLTVLIETAIDLAIEADLLVRFHDAEEVAATSSGSGGNNAANQKMAVYLSIFALAHVFQFGMACDAVYNRNTLQFLCLTIFNALFLVYAIIQIGEIRSSLSPAVSNGFSHIPIDVLTTIIPIVISVAELAYIALGWKIYTEFGWKVYKFLGADRNIKKMYANFQIFECLVKFDVFFWVGFSVQFIWLVLQSNDWEYYVTVAALPLSIVLLVEGHLAARHENKWMMATFMSGCVGALIYFIYKLVKVLMFKDTEQFHLVWKTLTTFSLIAITLLLVTFILACIVMANFGRGLKTQFAKNKGAGHARWGSQTLNRAMATHPNRMSIE
ncbi:hypothetical protein JAAARDRAFT_37835 [Jaapia argillacea MUCL 33604]|uniref:Uncharacterized protein n=1 Tax=Jaapia argillacea MUCL 33604 TaxID=933084 RepID=A0A067PWL8_9AGAM|nr:hypothetical protein JAAARDRAFT_37835 [Jaapia argillacea MUCL 33604]